MASKALQDQEKRKECEASKWALWLQNLLTKTTEKPGLSVKSFEISERIAS